MQMALYAFILNAILRAINISLAFNTVSNALHIDILRNYSHTIHNV